MFALGCLVVDNLTNNILSKKRFSAVYRMTNWTNLSLICISKIPTSPRVQTPIIGLHFTLAI